MDVYSFGIVMWELLTGEEPYSNLRSEEIIGILHFDRPDKVDLLFKILFNGAY